MPNHIHQNGKEDTKATHACTHCGPHCHRCKSSAIRDGQQGPVRPVMIHLEYGMRSVQRIRIWRKKSPKLERHPFSKNSVLRAGCGRQLEMVKNDSSPAAHDTPKRSAADPADSEPFV